MKKMIVFLSFIFILGGCSGEQTENLEIDSKKDPKTEEASDREVDPATERIQAKGPTKTGVGGAEYTTIDMDEVVFDNGDYKVNFDRIEFQDHFSMENKSYLLYFHVDNMKDTEIYSLIKDVAVDGESLQVSEDTEKGERVEGNETNQELFIQARISDYDNPPTLDDQLEFTLEFKPSLDDEGEIVEEIVIPF